MVTIRNLSFAHVRPLFKKVNITIGNSQKVALTGPNGAGKSTLFKIITGNQSLQSGTVEVNGSIGYVPQEIKHDPILDNSSTVREFIDPHNIKDDKDLFEMIFHMEMSVDLYQSPQKLSGGQKTKLAIIRALVQEPDILLLDEPTNFLDVQGKKWVMQFLSTYPKTLLIISHDIELLDSAINKVIAINTHTQSVEEYKGNYSAFLKLKEKNDEFTRRKILNEQKHIKRMEESLTKLYKNNSDKGVRQRVMLSRRIERMKDSLPQLPPEMKLSFKLPTPSWVGELPIRARDISKSYNDVQVLDRVNFSIQRGERIALIGPNGAGKSTFIKCLMGSVAPDSGDIIRNSEVKIGYYSQEFETIDRNKTLLETVTEITGNDERFVRPFLASFMFQGNMVFQDIGSLSGGEKTRLSIAMLLLQDFNLLILDEPTTYLDVLSQRIILEALKKYTGAMLIVSHTEDFIRELLPNRALFLPENRIEYWSNDYLGKVSEV